MRNLKESAEEILDLYNYFNGAIIVDKNAVAIYYYNNRKDINCMSEKDVVGKHLTEVYPELDIEKSTIMEALENGTPTSNAIQDILTCKGQIVRESNTTMPIFDGDEIIGAVEVSRYLSIEDKFTNIYITPMADDKRRLYTVNDIVSSWPGMKRIKETVEKVSGTDSSVLIYGKTGTGKEMIAESIHSMGKRKSGRFVSQNCAAIPTNLLESILFGTVKGSFTGSENRKGLFEVASGGTLFLDEINSMDISIQAKILKAIEEQKITRVGDVDPIDIDIRIIAASNKNPWELVNSGALRHDLYYRLKVG